MRWLKQGSLIIAAVGAGIVLGALLGRVGLLIGLGVLLLGIALIAVERRLTAPQTAPTLQPATAPAPAPIGQPAPRPRRQGRAVSLAYLGSRVETILRLAEDNARDHLAEAQGQAAAIVAAAEARARDILAGAEAEAQARTVPATPGTAPAQFTDATTSADTPPSTV